MKTKLVSIYRDGEKPIDHDIKDPSIVETPDGSYMMFATVPGSIWGKWPMARYKADHPAGPWKEIGPVNVHNAEGPEMCAPSVHIEHKNGETVYKMYVQSSCFKEDGVIYALTSKDGENFYADPAPVMTKDDVRDGPHKVISLYDVAVSEISHNGQPVECMVVSGYRRIGCGDLYVSLKPAGANDNEWSKPVLALAQEDVPFHNHPDSKDFEWGLEGAKMIQLEKDLFVMVGVCFLGDESLARGTRQRVFISAATSPLGPFVPVSTPITPTAYDQGQGENGHPDVLDLKNGKFAIVYQERSGNGDGLHNKGKHLWHLRYVEMDHAELVAQAQAALETASLKKNFNLSAEKASQAMQRIEEAFRQARESQEKSGPEKVKKAANGPKR